MELRHREVTETDADGNTHHRTETYEERVNTWQATEEFRYVQWADISPDSRSLEFVS